MRNYLLSIALFFLTLGTYANPGFPSDYNSNCRYTLFEYYPTLKEKVKADLLNGVWTHQLSNDESVSEMVEIYEFEELGKLKQTVIFDDGHSETIHHFWRVEEIEDSAFLVIYDRTLEEEVYYALEQNCQGVELTDIINYETAQLAYQPELNNVELESIRLKIAGQWHYNGNPFDPAGPDSETELQSSFLNYEFDLDGHFVRIMGAGEQKVEDHGFWEVSKDGNFLTMSYSKTGSKEDVYSTQFVRLLGFDKDQMIVEQTLTSIQYESVFTSGKKLFSLNRAIQSF